jgi:hypothetical protein
MVFSKRFLAAGMAVSLGFSAEAFEPRSDGVVQHQYEGSLGESRIGMTIIRDGNQIEGGHYFYQKFLRDIPITGFMKDSQITLDEAGTGTFHLHFAGNGSEGGQPLDFANSIGMEGTWTSADGRRTYPVSLRGTLIRGGTDNGHRYGDVTRETDAEFEHRVQSLLRAVLAGDESTAVRFISYPMSANLPNGGTKSFRNPSEVLAAWNDVFTPALLMKLRNDLPHDMFVRDGMAMLGDGEARFDGKGLPSLNVPAPPVSRK